MRIVVELRKGIDKQVAIDEIISVVEKLTEMPVVVRTKQQPKAMRKSDEQYLRSMQK